MTTLKGVVRGRMIELDQPPGLPDGSAVLVSIQRTPPAPPRELPPPVETWCDRILFDDSVHETEKIVKGTRLLAEELVKELEAGRSDQEMLAAHPELTVEDVIALRNYARTPEGLRRSLGGWADDPEGLDEFLEWNRQQRKIYREIED